MKYCDKNDICENENDAYHEKCEAKRLEEGDENDDGHFEVDPDEFPVEILFFELEVVVTKLVLHRAVREGLSFLVFEQVIKDEARSQSPEK